MEKLTPHFQKLADYSHSRDGSLSNIEYSENFKKLLGELPDSKRFKRDFLTTHKNCIIKEHQKHLKMKRGNPCEANCRITKAFERNIPIIEAELNKLHWLNILMEDIAESLKKAHKK